MIEEKQINLSSIITVIWERGKRILIFTLVCAGLAAIATLTIHNRYHSVASLMMTPSKLGERIMQRPVIPIRTYEAFLTYPSLLEKMIEKYQLKQSPYKFRYPQDLFKRIRVAYIIDTALLEIHVQLEDPQVAADIANELAQYAVKTVSRLVEIEQVSSTSKIEEQSNKSFNDTIQYKNIYLESLQRNMKPFHMQTLNNYMSMYATDMQQKETLDASIVELEEKIRKFESEVFSATSEYKQRIQLRRAVVTDPLLLEEIREKKGGEISMDELQNIVFYEEQMDPYYNQLLMQYKSLLADLPSQIKKRDFLATRIDELKTEIVSLQSKIFDMDVEELITKGDFDRTMEIYSGINKEVGWAGTTVASERQDLLIVDPAVPVKKKVFPRRSLMVGLAGLSAFLLSFLYYLLLDLYGLVKLQTKREDTAA